MQELAPYPNMAIFDFARLQEFPRAARWDWYGGSVHARFHALDQVQLPHPALELPDAKRGKEDRTDDAKKEQGKLFATASFHGVVLTSPDGIPGIMFVLRWYMIHNEPAIVMSTITAVKM